jgi:hypothetical protein
LLRLTDMSRSFWSVLLPLLAAACSRAGSAADAAGAPFDGPAGPLAPEVGADRAGEDAPLDHPIDRHPPDVAADRTIDLSPDRDPPADRPAIICEGVDAGSGCGARHQACCTTFPACNTGLSCTALSFCDVQPCGDFLQTCCCRGGFPNGCGPDLLCRSGSCGRP